MALQSEPIFYDTIRRGTGAKRTLIHITNSEDQDLDLTIEEIEKPEWVELEDVRTGESVHMGASLSFKSRARVPIVANINTGHKFFPEDASRGERVRIRLSNGTFVDIGITLPKIEPHLPPFRGKFAIDFGTTNSCFAWKGGVQDRGASGGTKASSEIPSVIFFEDVSDARTPKYEIGTKALHSIRDNSWQTYSYVLSVKRSLGRGRTQFIMDRFGGKGKDHQREWSSEQIAAFIIRRIIEGAQEDIGGTLRDVNNIVATFPPMFSQDRKKAIAGVFRTALRDVGLEIQDDQGVEMNLDEANAAAFNYIYGTMLDPFRRREASKNEADLISYDFGGGTIDISLVNVAIAADPDDAKVKIKTKLNGLSGDANYGGDNVTLETFRLLKKRLALKIAEARQKEFSEDEAAAEAAAKETAKKKAGSWDLDEDEGEDSDSGGGGWFDKDSGGSWDDDDGDEDEKKPSGGGFWEEDKKDEPEEKGEGEEEIDEELVGFENRETPADYLAALRTVWEEREIVEATLTQRQTILDATVAKEKAEDKFVSQSQAEARAGDIERAIEIVIPTRYAVHRNENPYKENIARKLFHELWQEADTLKIRLSNEGKVQMAGTLKKLAKYSAVPTIRFNELEFTMEELDIQIEADIKRTLQKAKDLYDGTRTMSLSDGGGLSFGGATASRSTDLYVLLFGNSSNLPIVRRLALQVFKIDEQFLIMDRKLLKSAVARGACVEKELRDAFGERGLIQYNGEDFLGSIPYAIGLQHAELGMMGFEKGFCPVFERGTGVRESRILDERFFLIHEGMKDLAVFADYKDGSDPSYLGWFDFENPTPESELPPAEDREDAGTTIVSLVPKETPDPAPAKDGGGLALGGGLSFGAPAGGGLSVGQPAETPAPADGGEAGGDGDEAEEPQGFHVRIQLLPSRELLATHSKANTKHLLRIDPAEVPPERDPFVGTH